MNQSKRGAGKRILSTLLTLALALGVFQLAPTVARAVSVLDVGTLTADAATADYTYVDATKTLTILTTGNTLTGTNSELHIEVANTGASMELTLQNLEVTGPVSDHTNFRDTRANALSFGVSDANPGSLALTLNITGNVTLRGGAASGANQGGSGIFAYERNVAIQSTGAGTLTFVGGDSAGSNRAGNGIYVFSGAANLSITGSYTAVNISGGNSTATYSGGYAVWVNETVTIEPFVTLTGGSGVSGGLGLSCSGTATFANGGNATGGTSSSGVAYGIYCGGLVLDGGVLTVTGGDTGGSGYAAAALNLTGGTAAINSGTLIAKGGSGSRYAGNAIRTVSLSATPTVHLASNAAILQVCTGQAGDLHPLAMRTINVTKAAGLSDFIVDPGFSTTSDLTGNSISLVTSKVNTTVSLSAVPAVSNGKARRTDATTGTIDFHSTVDGTYYYAVVNSYAAAPSIDTTGAGAGAVTAGDNAGLSVTLPAGSNPAAIYDIYVVVKTADGAVSSPFMIAMPPEGTHNIFIETKDKVGSWSGWDAFELKAERSSLGTIVSFEFEISASAAPNNAAMADVTLGRIYHPGNGIWYFHAVVNSGEPDEFSMSFGPYWIDITAPVVTTSASAVAVSSSAIQLSAAANDANSGVDYYLWQTATAPGGPHTPIGATPDGSFLHDGLAPGTTYYYLLLVIDKAGNVSIAEAASATTLAGGGGGGGGGSSSTSASITPTRADFDINGGSDITVTLSAGSYTLLSLKNGSYTLVKDTDYTVNGNKYTIKAGYLKTLATGEQGITFDMSGGTDPKLTVTIKDTTKAWANPFTDVKEGAWYYDAVKYVYEKSLIIGTAEDKFSPDSTLTRGMIVTILYRHAGEPDVSGLSNPFDDVAAGQWYTDAVKWAANNGIVAGYGGGKYGPNDPVTKEQLAVIIYRTQQATGKIPTNTGGTSIPDAGKVSTWATDAVNALNNQGIFKDIPGDTFNPQTPASRAEVASMLYRYLTAVE